MFIIFPHVLKSGTYQKTCFESPFDLHIKNRSRIEAGCFITLIKSAIK